MDTHHFNGRYKGTKILPHICWGKRDYVHHSLEPLGRQLHGHNYKICLGRDMSKLGNSHKQLFHAWRSFTFDENTETIRFLCDKYKTGSKSLSVWRAADIRDI